MSILTSFAPIQSAITTALGGIWGYVAVAGLATAASVTATLTVDGWRYGATISDMKTQYAVQSAQSATASLKQFQSEVNTIQSAAQLFIGWRTGFNDQITSLSDDLHKATAAKPLPADCKPDAERLRIVNAAIDATNKSRTTGQ